MITRWGICAVRRQSDRRLAVCERAWIVYWLPVRTRCDHGSRIQRHNELGRTEAAGSPKGDSLQDLSIEWSPPIRPTSRGEIAGRCRHPVYRMEPRRIIISWPCLATEVSVIVISPRSQGRRLSHDRERCKLTSSRDHFWYVSARYRSDATGHSCLIKCEKERKQKLVRTYARAWLNLQRAKPSSNLLFNSFMLSSWFSFIFIKISYFWDIIYLFLRSSYILKYYW